MKLLMDNKDGLAPLAATFLFIAFAISVGVILMSVSSSYASEIGAVEEASQNPFCYEIEDFDHLKLLQIEYIKGEITLEEYIQREKLLLSNG